ncbi:MAG TPA: hypothetical protein VFS91_11515, partial [Nitrobacter sp.]|nr:hypothetical protein [Nitrobacter sp.]
MRKLLRALLAAVLIAWLTAPALAGPPTSTDTTPVAGLATDRSILLGAVDGHAVAIEQDGKRAFVLGDRGWSAVDASRIGTVGNKLSVVSDGRRSVLVSGTGGVARTIAMLGHASGGIDARTLPPLPVPLKYANAAFEGDALLITGIAGDGTARLFRLSLTVPDRWLELPVWPGGGTPTALAAQNGGIFVILASGQQWRHLPTKGWRVGAPTPGKIIPGSPRAIGQAYLLYLVDGAKGPRLYSYSAITDVWAPLGPPLLDRPVAAVARGDGILAASHDGRGLAFSALTLKSSRQSLAPIDALIIGIYLFAMLGIGLIFYRRTKKGQSAEFFLGSRSIPAWAAGISMFAGSISSISYLAVPAKAFETDWQYIMSKIMTICGLVFVAIVVVPIFRRLSLVSVFNYLETRFHPAIRMLSSALWIMMQVGG